MPWTPESLSDLATGYWRSQALSAALDTGLFDLLPTTATEAATRGGLDARLALALLEALTALGVVTRAGEVFSLEPSAAPYLTSAGPTSLAAALRFNASMYGLWGKLPDAVRTGKPVLPPGAHLGQDPARTRAFAMAMHSRGLALLPGVADAIDLAGVSRLLDVGSGAGTLGHLLAAKHPGLRLTLLDLPAITDVARELTPAAVASRITHLAGDYFKAPLPDGHDAVIHCGALHQHAPDAARTLVARLATAARPGGRVILIDLFADPNRQGPAFQLLFALNMALVAPSSHTHSTSEAEGYLRDAGLTDVRTTDTPGGMYRVVAGTR